MLERVERPLRQMDRLVADLLDAARLKHGKLALQPRRIAVAEVIGQALDDTHSAMEAKRHACHLHVAEDLKLDADPDRLCQVLVNLLINAARYTPPRGEIDVTAEREDREAVIRVRDNGIGMPPEQLDSMFEMFRQGGSSSAGLGIGLALARDIVDLHGGTVQAKSMGVDRGTEITVRLPLPA
jgi:signal transduction histidine kinase